MKAATSPRLAIAVIPLFVWLASFLLAAEQLPQPREKNVYIPYDKLWETFEQDRRGVFLPHDEFEQLWQKAYGTKTEPATKPPRDAVISQLQASLNVGDNAAQGTITLEVELFTPGWILLPLALGDGAIGEPKITGIDNARVIHDPTHGYTLLAYIQQPEKNKATVTMRWVREINRAPGRNSLTFKVPAAAVNQWELTFPLPDAQIEVSGEGVLKETMPAEAGNSKIRLHAAPGSQPLISWAPKAEGAKGLEALINVTTTQVTSMEEGLVRTKAEINFAISRAPVTTLALLIPANQRVTTVFDPNVREWQVRDQGQEQLLELTLHEPVTAKQQLTLELECTPADWTLVETPCLRVPAALRQQGRLNIMTTPGLKVEVKEKTGLNQLNMPEARPLTQQLQTETLFASYQYAGVPWQLQLALQLLKPEIFSRTLHAYTLGLDSLQLRSTFQLSTRQAGLYEVNLELPSDLRLLDCQVKSLAPANAVVIADQFLGDVGNGRRPLRLAFKSKQEQLEIVLVMRQDLNAAALLTPHLPPHRLVLAGPRLAPDTGANEEGRLTLQAPANLRLTPVATSQLRAADDRRAVLAYQFSTANPLPQLTVEAARRPPHCTVAQMLRTEITTGNKLQYQAQFRAEVEHSGVKSLTFAVPADLLPKLRLTPAQYRLQPLDNQPDGLPPEYQAVSLQGEQEFFGACHFTMHWSDEFGDLPLGGVKSFAIPRILAFGDRVWGQIAFLKHEMIDISPVVAEKLLPIDPRFNLIKGLTPGDATAAPAWASKVARAFEYHDQDWSLEAKITRYQNETVKSISVEKLLTRAVFTRGGTLSMQVAGRMRSTLQRLELRLPEGSEFDSNPVLLNGRPAPLEKGEPGQYFIPLTAINQGELFFLELRYLQPKVKQGHVSLPSFPEEAAIQHAYLSVHIPKNLSLLGILGSWDSANTWRWHNICTLRQHAQHDANFLTQWLLQGQNAQAAVTDSLNSFVIDGQALLYSTLHPAPDGIGDLRLRLYPSWQCQAILIIVILAFGLLLRAAPFYQQCVTTAILAGVFSLLAIFLPSLVASLLSDAAALAAVLVFLLWIFHWWRRHPDWARKIFFPTKRRASSGSRDNRLIIIILVLVGIVILFCISPIIGVITLLIILLAVTVRRLKKKVQPKLPEQAKPIDTAAENTDNDDASNHTTPQA